MALVPPDRQADSSTGSGQRHRLKYGSSWRTTSETTKKRFFFVAGGLAVIAILATTLQFARGRENDAGSLSESTQLWDMTRKISQDQIKRAVKEELSATFEKERRDLESSLSIDQGTPDYSFSDDRRRRSSRPRLFHIVVFPCTLSQTASSHAPPSQTASSHALTPSSPTGRRAPNSA